MWGKIKWMLTVVYSAFNALAAILIFDKSPFMAIICGIVSLLTFRVAQFIDRQNIIKKGLYVSDKVVAMINEDPEVEEICKRIDQRKQFAVKKIHNLETKLHEAHQSMLKESKDDWDILITWLKNKGRMPEGYNDQTHNVGFDLKTNGVTVGRNDLGGMPRVKNMGSCTMEDLPPHLQKAMREIISSRMGKHDGDDPDNAS